MRRGRARLSIGQFMLCCFGRADVPCHLESAPIRLSKGLSLRPRDVRKIEQRSPLLRRRRKQQQMTRSSRVSRF
jgi:hypothetical protein